MDMSRAGGNSAVTAAAVQRVCFSGGCRLRLPDSGAVRRPERRLCAPPREPPLQPQGERLGLLFVHRALRMHHFIAYTFALTVYCVAFSSVHCCAPDTGACSLDTCDWIEESRSTVSEYIALVQYCSCMALLVMLPIAIDFQWILMRIASDRTPCRN